MTEQPPGTEDKQVRLLSATNPGHFSLIRAYHLADFITLMNGFCGFMSITSSMRYCLDPHDKTYAWAALGFMPFGLFFDFLDGKVARWRQKSSLMGAELDSLADLVRWSMPGDVGYEAHSFGRRSRLERRRPHVRSRWECRPPWISCYSPSSFSVVWLDWHGST